MSINFNGSPVKKVLYNGSLVREVIYNGHVVYVSSTTVDWYCFRYYPGAGVPNHYADVSIPEGVLPSSDQIKVELYGSNQLIDTKYITASNNSVRIPSSITAFTYGSPYYLILTSPSGATTRIDLPMRTNINGESGSVTISL